MLIFVSSTGRSGTTYLSKLVSHISDTKGYHVPEPQCTGKVLIDCNNYKDNAVLSVKKESIRKSIKNGRYFESSPLFLRCFVEEALELGEEMRLPVGVIHLTRDPLQVARSYNNRNSVPGSLDCVWRLPMEARKNFLKITEGLTSYQKNLWDWFENEIRFHHYKSKFDKTYDMYFSDLNNISKLKEMLAFFGMTIDQNKLENNLHEGALDKNSNEIKTNVSLEDKKEGGQFIEILKRYDIGNIFDDSYYIKYKMLNKLRRL